MSIKWIESRRASRLSGEHFIRVAFYSTKKKRVRQVSLHLSEGAMKKFRWCVGDRVDIGFDGELMCIRRSATGTYAISTQRGNQKDVVGTMSSSKINFSEQDNFPTLGKDQFCVSEDDVDISSDGIVFFLIR